MFLGRFAVIILIAGLGWKIGQLIAVTKHFSVNTWEWIGGIAGLLFAVIATECLIRISRTKNRRVY